MIFLLYSLFFSLDQQGIADFIIVLVVLCSACVLHPARSKESGRGEGGGERRDRKRNDEMKTGEKVMEGNVTQRTGRRR